MKQINIKCIATDSIDILKYHIWIYNLKDKLVYEGSSKCGNIFFTPPHNGVFKLVIQFKNSSCRICKMIYIHSNMNPTFCFKFQKKTKMKHSITFHVTDHHYRGLPIEKGEIFIWQNNI